MKDKETLEEVVERLYPNKPFWIGSGDNARLYDEFKAQRDAFINGTKWQAKRMYSEEDMIAFAEFIATYPDKNRNINGQILHAKSKYDGAERTIDLLQEWIEQFKKEIIMTQQEIKDWDVTLNDGLENL